MNLIAKIKSSLLGLVLFLVLADAIADHITSSACADNHETQCLPRRETRPKLALFIDAANGDVDWEGVNSLAGSNWEVRVLVLGADFGTIMKEDSFTAALEHSYPMMKEGLNAVQPDLLLASSKGIGVIAYLASKNLWVQRPVILFSPIPNPIDGLVGGSSYELEWSDTIDTMRHHRLGPILVAAGSSSDEEMFISQAMQEPSACGEISKTTGEFENCKGWRHVTVPGDHGWKNLPENEVVVSKMIEYMFSLLDKNKEREMKERKQSSNKGIL